MSISTLTIFSFIPLWLIIMRPQSTAPSPLISLPSFFVWNPLVSVFHLYTVLPSLSVVLFFKESLISPIIESLRLLPSIPASLANGKKKFLSSVIVSDTASSSCLAVTDSPLPSSVIPNVELSSDGVSSPVEVSSLAIFLNASLFPTLFSIFSILVSARI